ncbi:hypothetical protein NL676_036089 [Syzygium grande]|nr:hypothetical protein NL676_036089 [Syzygium grande]
MRTVGSFLRALRKRRPPSSRGSPGCARASHAVLERKRTVGIARAIRRRIVMLPPRHARRSAAASTKEKGEGRREEEEEEIIELIFFGFCAITVQEEMGNQGERW